MKKATQRNLLIALAGLALLLVLTTPDRSPELEEPVPARVLVATVLNHDLLPQQSVSGHLAPMRRASLHFELSGQVRERLVEPGQSVEAGAMLLRWWRMTTVMPWRGRRRSLNSSAATSTRTASCSGLPGATMPCKGTRSPGWSNSARIR